MVKAKKIKLYIIALSLILITNYYIGFMVCIFSCVYFIYKLILEKAENKKEIFKKIGIFILGSIISAMIASFILIPIFIGLRNRQSRIYL